MTQVHAPLSDLTAAKYAAIEAAFEDQRLSAPLVVELHARITRAHTPWSTQVVDDRHFVTASSQALDQMRPDEAGPTRHDDPQAITTSPQ